MTADDSPKIGAILLAAGGSSRLGRPKQLVEFQGKTLIRRAAEMLVASVCSPVVVVLGAEIARCSDELAGLDISICINENWSDGISSSIKTGLRDLLELQPDVDAAVIALCDQPFVIDKDFNLLCETFFTAGLPIVAARYGETIGVPALFASEMFDELFSLEGDEGARKLIRRYVDTTSTVAIGRAKFDIDTPADLTRNSP